VIVGAGCCEAVLHACVVRQGALVGINAVVMAEAKIGARVIVVAGGVATRLRRVRFYRPR